MPTFRLPLSGNVSQTINPWTWLFNMAGGQVGLVNIDLGRSGNPAVEEEVLSDVASYGRQLGRIEDALAVLVKHFKPQGRLTKEESAALDALTQMTKQIAEIKTKHTAQSRV